MNPLPNRPLLSNPSLPLSLPNVPSFDQIAYNGRPRKAMPDLSKEFPQMMSAPPSVQGSQINALDRNVPQPQQTQQQQTSTGSGPQSQQPEQPNKLSQTQPPQPQQVPSQLHSQDIERNHDGDIEPRQLTAIFRPDDAGEWKERLRMSHEAAERERLERTGEPPMGGVASWERGGSDDEHGSGKDIDEEDEEEPAASFGEGSEADGAKLWKAKRTLRK